MKYLFKTARPQKMKQFMFTLLLLLSQVMYGQHYFDGLLHEPIGEAEFQITDDTLTLTSSNTDQISGLDIKLGETKGFGFTFSEIDPFLSPNGAYIEWRMYGTQDGVPNQFLWKETHQVNNQNGMMRVDVLFDASPIKAEGNALRLMRNNTLVYEGVFENGLIYSIEADPAIVSASDWYCRPIPELWDGTCVARPPIIFPQSIVVPDGTKIPLNVGDELAIETFAINPASPPSLCSKVESRSYQSAQSQFYDEGLVMFESRTPFYAIGDIVYDTNLDFLKISEIDNSGTEGVRIPLDEANSFDLDWKPISDYGDNYSIEISSKGLVNEEYQTLGKVKHELSPNTNQFLTTVNRRPSGCGKTAGLPDFSPIVCYYLEFEGGANFDIQGISLQGDEIRILSTTDLPIKYLSEFSLLLSDINEIVIIDNPSSLCTPVINLGTATLSSGIVHAQNEVISAGTILPETNVSFKAGQCIRLNTGFNSDANADLKILIEDCGPQ